MFQNNSTLTLKVKPKKFIRMKGFLLAHTYMIIIVNACPRNSKEKKNVKISIQTPPKICKRADNVTLIDIHHVLAVAETN